MDPHGVEHSQRHFLKIEGTQKDQNRMGVSAKHAPFMSVNTAQNLTPTHDTPHLPDG